MYDEAVCVVGEEDLLCVIIQAWADSCGCHFEIQKQI